ncbi:prenyltransferase/squalene oxidase repeat-containing protein [Schlesneria paludicola]|uniref:prenyltransferase/squalene oxidase repeat-containing protein n=1 Tax=Schlesneria paludicola TaxID=360056 RepID=UPI001ED95891|nr:prenyltransferase/squalene oxidase repeat-containing protein [Schlesneria paludicola]
MTINPIESVQIVVVSLALCLLQGSDIARAAEPELSDDAIRTAILKSVPLLERGAKGSLELRKQCFNCHNQGLPLMALQTAEKRGFVIDTKHIQQQVRFTFDFLGRNQDRYRAGEGQGGQVDTAGYALWALDEGGWKPDDTTAAVVEYLLIKQHDQEHWESDANRPPAEQSYFTSTYVALRGLKVFGVPEQRERIEARVERVRNWLLRTLPADTEDRVFRLRALALIDAPSDVLQQATQDLVTTQQPDGGWSQTREMTSDTYATGTTLVALHDVGGVSTTAPAYRRGLQYLISNQLDDGSWHVVSHSKPFQTYFESGYPHGKDQFISIAAASWATTALAIALPPTQESAP